MLDMNNFKSVVKQWIKENPTGSLDGLRDFCEDQIPAHQFVSYEWLVNQTLDWYRHILHNRQMREALKDGTWDVD
jgi:hypothetical protein